MRNCQFYLPVQMFFGRDCVIKEGPGVFQAQGQKALIVTGALSAKVNGALDDVKAALEKNQQEAVLFDKIMSNPTVDCVYEGAELAKENAVDFVIAIGGGSPMDAAKAIALLAREDIPREELFTWKPTKGALPLICIPMTAGTGSEGTPYSVLMNDEQQTKSSLADPCLFAQAALVDGKYMKRLSRPTTINTALDALSHLVESMLSKRVSPITRALSLRGIRMLAPYLKELDKMELTPEDRDALLEASLLGGMVIAQTSTTVVHLLGYPLTYFHKIDHGRANGLLLAAYLRKMEKTEPVEVTAILGALGMAFVGELEELIARLLEEKEPLTLAEVKRYAAASIKNPKSQSCLCAMTEADFVEIYRESFGL